MYARVSTVGERVRQTIDDSSLAEKWFKETSMAWGGMFDGGGRGSQLGVVGDRKKETQPR